MSVFAVTVPVLAGLSDGAAVEAFRDLLWARALERGIATTEISIWSDVDTADGGIDAAVLSETPPRDDDLLRAGTGFQIKTGDFKPWRPSVVRKELYKTKRPGRSSLGVAVRRTLDEDGRIVVCCFGVDPTDEQLRKARENFLAEFATCGYSSAKVEVWRQTHLVGLFNRYPSLCLRLRGHDHTGFLPWLSWSQHADMTPAVHYGPEQQQSIDELRERLRGGGLGHVRLVGEPGVGKTRMALELTGTGEFAPVTLYVRDGRTLLQSSFINELLQTDDLRFVVFVVDECPPKDRAEIWNVLKPRCGRVRLITIDHADDNSTDEKTRVYRVEPVGKDQIVAILKDYDIGDFDADRWASFCEGCPRVAHVLGANLRNDRSSLLQPPASVDVWDRFIVGRDDPLADAVREQRRVLRYVALFERFGFEPPVGEEAEFIAGLAGVPWGSFQDIVDRLRRRRILQGAKTLYLTPRLLHIYLYREFWETEGRTFRITEHLDRMPEALRPWFVEMLRYAHDSKAAERAVQELLGTSGLFPGGEFPDDPQLGRLILALAEACPAPTLRCLRRTVGAMEVGQLRDLSRCRQFLVWALERLAVWKDHFTEAASLLLALAEAENDKNASNATGTFRGLFSLVPGMAATQADFAARYLVLRDALGSGSPERRRIGLLASETALDSDSGFRIIGPEHQGLRRTLDFWLPNTWGDLWDCHGQVWQLLLEKLRDWKGSDREQLTATLITAGSSILDNKRFSGAVLETFRLLAVDPATDIKHLLTWIRWHLRRGSGKLPSSVRRELRTICRSLDGHDFSSRLRRFVRHATWDDFYDAKAKRKTIVEKQLDALADQAVEASDSLVEELPWLVREHSGPAAAFGYRVSLRDRERRVLPSIIDEQFRAGDNSPCTLLCGYLAAVREQDQAEWEAALLRLADDPRTARRFSDLVIGSGVTDEVVRRVIEQCRAGDQDLARLEQWWFSGQLRSVNEGLFKELLALQLDEGSGRMWSNAVHMCHTFYLDKEVARSLPEDLLLRLLTHEGMSDGHVTYQASYYWSRLAAALLKQHPSRTWDLFRGVIKSAEEWSVLRDLDMGEEQVLTTILRENPRAAFRCLAEVCEERQRGRYGIQRWLAAGNRLAAGDGVPGPIQFIPSETLFAWVDGDIEDRGCWLARALPKTFDKTPAGRLTRDFVVRYGGNEHVASCVHAAFHSRSWCGKASDMYRELRDEARAWLADETNINVVRWFRNYISGLGHSIERAEAEEERRGE